MERNLITWDHQFLPSDKYGQGPCCTVKAMGEVRMNRMLNAKARGGRQELPTRRVQGKPSRKDRGVRKCRSTFSDLKKTKHCLQHKNRLYWTLISSSLETIKP